MDRTKTKERIGRTAFMIAATVCVLAVAAIFVFLIAQSIPAFSKIGLGEFLFGQEWSPDRTDTFLSNPLSGSYGVLTMAVGSLAATLGALLFGGITGYFTAVFLVFFCPKKLKKPLGFVVDLLAGIPSVVYGYFGITCLLPVLALFAPNNGTGLLATSLVLGIMLLPTVVSISKTSMEAVPKSYYEGAVALGATHEKAVFKTVVPAARSGVTASLVLGVGRALGETMAVVMVAGNSPAFPNGLFLSFRVLTANIVLEMGYAGELQEGALVATGVVLLFFVFLVNLAFFALSSHRKKEGTTRGRRLKEWRGNIAHRLHAETLGKIAAYTAGGVTGTALLAIVGFVLVKGVPHLSKDLLFGAFEFAGGKVTVLPALVATLMTVALSLLIAVPLGVMTAIFLVEYAPKNNRAVRLIRGAIDVLSGVPSIVYGLFGMITFVKIFGGTGSVLAGSLTVSIMLLPTIVRATEESLQSVADTLRAGSFALGAGKMRTIFKVVLPSAASGVLSAVILSIGRVIGESAPFLYTMGSVIKAIPKSYLDGGATLSVALYQLSGEGWHTNEAFATAVVLVLLVITLNLLAELIAGRIRKKINGR